jgi:hypothetical protein
MIKTAIAYSDITPEESVPLMGYGDRTHSSEGVHDSLFAYAWWLEPEGVEPFVWVVLDLCLLSVISVNDLAAKISGKIGLAKEQILISATHTHSGPDVRFVSGSSQPWARKYYKKLIAGCAEAIQKAREQAVVCRIEVRTAESDLGVNRRESSSPIDPRVVMFSLFDDSGAERGFLFHYSCHLTVLGVDNYLISADWLGPVRTELQKELGIPVMFLQGAEGNVDPVSRGALDMADPDQAVGSSFEVMEQIAEKMSAGLRSGRNSKPVSILERGRVESRTVSLPLRYGGLTPDQVQAKLEEWKRKFSSFLEIAPEEVPESSIVNVMVKEQSRKKNLDAEQTRRWVAEQFTYASFLNIYKTGGEMIDGNKGQVHCPIHLLDFGPVKILGIPMEVLLDVAFDWRQRVPDRIALIAGLFGGWIGYLPHKNNFQEPRATQLYETVCTMFAPEASIQLLEEAEHMIRRE